MNAIPVVLVTTDNHQYDTEDVGDGPDRMAVHPGISVEVHYSDGGYHLIPWHMVAHITYQPS